MNNNRERREFGDEKASAALGSLRALTLLDM